MLILKLVESLNLYNAKGKTDITLDGVRDFLLCAVEVVSEGDRSIYVDIKKVHRINSQLSLHGSLASHLPEHPLQALIAFEFILEAECIIAVNLLGEVCSVSSVPSTGKNKVDGRYAHSRIAAVSMTENGSGDPLSTLLSIRTGCVFHMSLYILATTHKSPTIRPFGFSLRK